MEQNRVPLETLHVPVLLSEVLRWMAPQPGGSYVDATVGGGGHSAALLEASGPHGRVLSLDVDPAAVARARHRLQAYGSRSVVLEANFRHLDVVCRQRGFPQVDGVLLDLGLSSDQLADGDRGFALLGKGQLDMRFSSDIPTTAADLVNSLTEAALADLIYLYGDETRARRIARAIVASRPLYTSDQLAAVIARTLGRRGRLHPATKTFQALRIAVNDELGALEEALPKTLGLLRPRGRLVVIAFHSLEDRIVKRFMQQEARDCICPPEILRCTCGHRASLRVLTRKPVQPAEDETARNPRSRSAKLRAAERLSPAHS